MIDNEDAKREEARRAKFARARFRQAVQAVMGTEEGRRVVQAFMDTACIDLSPYRTEPSAMAFAVGWQDAARWWLAAIREHCPEREAQMRNEAKRDARETGTDEDE